MITGISRPIASRPVSQARSVQRSSIAHQKW